MNQNTLQLTIEVDDKGSVKLQQLGKQAQAAGDASAKSMKGLRGQVDKLKGSTDVTVRSLAGMAGLSFAGVVAGVAGMVAGMGRMVESSGQSAREVDNLARLAGMSSTQFQEYSFAAKGAGIETDKFADISKDTHDKLGDFIATGGGGFADFFEQVAPKVGLTASELQNLSGPEVLMRVKQAMDDANVSAEEQVFYLESIASDAALLTPLLEKNGAAFKAQADKAHELGLVLESVDSQRLIAAQGKIDEVRGILTSLKDHVAADLAPVVTDLGNRFINSMSAGEGGVRSIAQTIASGLLTTLGSVIEAMRFFHNGWLGLKLVGTAAVHAIAVGVEHLYSGLRTILKPLDLLMKAAVYLDALDVNPFDTLDTALETFSSSSGDVTQSVLEDIEKTNAGYDRIGQTIKGFIAELGQMDSSSSEQAMLENYTAVQGSMTQKTVEEANKRAVIEKELAAKSASEREKLAVSLADRTNQLVMSELGYKQWALDQEVAAMRAVAGEDQQLQDKITAYRVAKLKDFEKEAAASNQRVQSNLQRITEVMGKTFVDNVEGAILQSLGRTENAWEQLWNSMLAKLGSVVAEMAVTWATSQIANFTGWSLPKFHAGLWSLADDEMLSILQHGEMVVPSWAAEEIRSNLGRGFQDGSWDALVKSTDGRRFADMDSWGGEYGAIVGGKARDLLAGVLGSALLNGPDAALRGALSPDTLQNLIGGSLLEAGLRRMSFGQPEAWVSAGGFLSNIAGLVGLTRGVRVPFVSELLNFGASWLTNKIGDVLNDRSWENIKDAYERGLITHAQAVNTIELLKQQGVKGDSGSVLNSTVSRLGDFFKPVGKAVRKGWASIKDTLGIGKERKTVGLHISYDGSRDGDGDFNSRRANSSGGATFNERTGGYDTHGGGSAGFGPGLAAGGVVNRLMVPRGDDGFAALSYDEGVVDRDTMRILSRSIRSGEFGGTSAIVAEVRALGREIRGFRRDLVTTSKRALTLHRRWEKLGMPQVRSV